MKRDPRALLVTIVLVFQAGIAQAAAAGRAAETASRAGMGDFDATGRIPCARYRGQPTGPCDFGVSRAGDGSATVVVTHPDGGKRTIFFSQGEALGADTGQAEGYPEFRVHKESDLFFIRIGDERYELPGAVVFGG